MSDSHDDTAVDHMIRFDLVGRGISDPAVIQAMRDVPRDTFVPAHLSELSYADKPLYIGCGQTISQPYMVAAMTEALRIPPGARVLEIGTGSGYQTAILCKLAGHVYTIERIDHLLTAAENRLESLGFDNVSYRWSDGTEGWPDESPFDRIIVTAGAPDIPAVLEDQLADGGVMVIPAGPRNHQILWRITRTGQSTTRERLMDCVFVPLIGKHGYPGSPTA